MDWEISCKDLMTVAWKLYDQGDFPKTLHVWKSIHRLFPNEPEVYRASALAYKRMGDYENADVVLSEGTKLHPDNRTLLADLAYLAQEQKNWPAALERWEGYRRRFPDDALGFLGVSIALRELDRCVAAEQILQTAVARYPDNSQLLASRAYVAQQRNDWEEALQRWNIFRDKFPDEPIGYSSTGVALFTLQRFKEADAVLEEGLAALSQSSTTGRQLCLVGHPIAQLGGSLAALDGLSRPIPDRSAGPHSNDAHPWGAWALRGGAAPRKRSGQGRRAGSRTRSLYAWF